MIGWAGVGLAAGGLLLVFIGPPGAGIWGIPLGMTIAFFGFFIAAMRTSTPQGFRSAVRAARGTDPGAVRAARAAGRLGVARIDAIRQTGLEVNDQPMCELDLTVLPASGEAFRTATQRLVLITEIPRFQPGRRVVVAILTEGGPAVEIVSDDPDAAPWASVIVPAAEEVKERHRDGGSGRGPSAASGSGGRFRLTRPLRVALAVTGLLVGAAVVLVPHRLAVAQTLAAIPDGRLTADHRTPEVLAPALTAMLEEAGHDRLMSVYISESHISFEAPLEPGARASDDWMYHRGVLERRGASAIQPEHAAEQFSASEVAWDRIWPAIEEARKQAGVADLSEAYASVGRDLVIGSGPGATGGWTGPIQIRIQISDDYRDFTFEMAADGTGLELTSSS